MLRTEITADESKREAHIATVRRNVTDRLFYLSRSLKQVCLDVVYMVDITQGKGLGFCFYMQ
jgi:hypothetical protein